MLARYMWLTAVIIGFPQVSSSNQKVVSPFHLWISWEPTLTQLPSAHWVNGGAEWGLRLVAGRWLGVLVCPCAPGMAWSCWEKLCCRLRNLPQLFSEEFSKLSGACLTLAMFSEESQLLAVIAWAGTRWLVPCESGAVEGLFLLVGKWGKDPVYAVPQLKVSLMAKPKNSKMNVFWRGFKPPSLVPQGWQDCRLCVSTLGWMQGVCSVQAEAQLPTPMSWACSGLTAMWLSTVTSFSVHPLWGTKQLVWAHKAGYSIWGGSCLSPLYVYIYS